jgi:hypothetical protein
VTFGRFGTPERPNAGLKGDVEAASRGLEDGYRNDVADPELDLGGRTMVAKKSREGVRPVLV